MRALTHCPCRQVCEDSCQLVCREHQRNFPVVITVPKYCAGPLSTVFLAKYGDCSGYRHLEQPDADADFRQLICAGKWVYSSTCQANTDMPVHDVAYVACARSLAFTYQAVNPRWYACSSTIMRIAPSVVVYSR
jgi:hypothetical protein